MFYLFHRNDLPKDRKNRTGRRRRRSLSMNRERRRK
jgi:hypothetical protein